MSDDPADRRVVALRRAGGTCPICGKAAAARHRPFCSPRCAEVDLGRWLGDGYRIETDEQPETEDGAED